MGTQQERLILPDEYTPEIKREIAKIEHQMRNTLIPFDNETIKVFEYQDIIYILANPILGTEWVINGEGEWEEVPLYNITLVRPKDWLQIKPDDIVVKPGLLRIMRPDLCERIAK